MKVCDIPTWSTTSSAATIPPSTKSRIAGDTFAYQTDRNFDLEDVHVTGAARIAESVAKYDVDRFVHVSSFNADKNSPSEFFRTKVRYFAL